MKKLDIISKTLLGMGITMLVLYCGLAGVLMTQIF